MFSEILRIKPKLDAGDAQKMEKNLQGRFGRVAKRFGAGLKGAIKGSIVGISLGLLSKLLNPLKEIEERIRTLMGEAEDQKELADKFGTTTGNLKNIQDVSKVIGVKPDKLNELMDQFYEAVKKAKTELADPSMEKSDSTIAVGNYLDNPDIAASFFKFIQNLKSANPDDRAKIEKEVFGSEQYGSAKRFIDADMATELKKLGNISSDKLTSANDSLAAKNQRLTQNDVQISRKNLVGTNNLTGNGIIDQLIAAQNRDQAAEQRELSTISHLQKAQAGMDELAIQLKGLSNVVTGLLGKIGDLITAIKKIPFLSKFFNQ